MGAATATQSVRTPVSLRGRIETVFYAGPHFSAGRILTPDGERASFAGKLYAREDDSVVLWGEWTTHPKYGKQFQVESMECDLDLDADGLAHYLANHPDIKGIGPVKAGIIAR